MKSSTTSGIRRRRLKLGQLFTLGNHVYQCVKYKGDFVACKDCVFTIHELWAESYRMCKLCNRNGYFRRIK